MGRFIFDGGRRKRPIQEAKRTARGLESKREAGDPISEQGTPSWNSTEKRTLAFKMIVVALTRAGKEM